MKKSTYIVGMILAAGLSSCSSSIEDAAGSAEEMLQELKSEEPTIEGLWNLSDFDMGMEVPADRKAEYDAMLEEMTENSNVSFRDDGTFTQNDYMQDQMSTINGTYVLQEDKLTFTVDDEVQEMNLESLTATELRYSFENNGQKMTMTYKRPTY